MRAGFRAHAHQRLPGWLLVLAVFAALVGVFELIRVIIPFQPVNPLWQQVTIGQSVLNGWMYGGEDEEGYLRFYNQGQSIVLPPKTRLFTVDGTFVVIERYSPDTLTFAEPWYAIPTGWLAALATGTVLGGYVLVRRSVRRQRGPFRVRRGVTAGLGKVRWRARPGGRTGDPAADPAPPRPRRSGGVFRPARRPRRR